MAETLSVRLLGSLDLELDARALPPLGSARAESLFADVLTAFERAIAVARRQGAHAYEIQADESLARYRGK